MDDSLRGINTLTTSIISPSPTILSLPDDIKKIQAWVVGQNTGLHATSGGERMNTELERFDGKRRCHRAIELFWQRRIDSLAFLDSIFFQIYKQWSHFPGSYWAAWRV